LGAEHLRHLARLGDPLAWDLDVEVAREDLARPRVLDAIEQLAQDAEARGYDAAGRAGVHALREHLGREDAADHAAERGRAPELLVVAAARVEAHDQARRAELRLERVDVVGQVRAPALLARLDEHDAARVARPLLLQRLDRGERGEGGVAVVADAAAVELVAAAHRRPGPGAL